MTAPRKKPAPVESRFLTPAEAAELLEVSTDTLRRLADRGDIRTARLSVGSPRRYFREDITALLEERS
jgi:excisionase family DNA binding protein